MIALGGRSRLLGEVEPAKLTESADGWDEVVETICVMDQMAGHAGDQRFFFGSGIQGAFFLQTKTCVGFRSCFPIMEYRSKGLATNKDYVASCTAYGERVTGLYTGFPGVPVGPQKMNILMSRVGVTIRRWVTSKPDCTNVSKPETPPETFGLPLNPFGFLVDPTYNFPYGWVLEKRDGDQLPGSTRYLEVSYYSYYRYAEAGPGEEIRYETAPEEPAP